MGLIIINCLQLKLIEGINNDTIVSCMVTPGHLFLQQPTHPSFPSLNVLSGYINMCYSETDSPLLPNPIPGKDFAQVRLSEVKF